MGTGRPEHCPDCQSIDFYRVGQKKDQTGPHAG
jgi:hypothetical protein